MSAQRDALRERLDRATAHLDPPVAAVDLAAFLPAPPPWQVAPRKDRSGSRANRSGCRSLLARALGRPHWHEVLACPLPEAICLVRTAVAGDALVAYPTADRNALVELAADAGLTAAVTLMVDDPAQPDLVTRLPPLTGGAGGLLRLARGAPARAGHRDRPRRGSPRARREPASHPVVAGRLTAERH